MEEIVSDVKDPSVAFGYSKNPPLSPVGFLDRSGQLAMAAPELAKSSFEWFGSLVPFHLSTLGANRSKGGQAQINSHNGSNDGSRIGDILLRDDGDFPAVRHAPDRSIQQLDSRRKFQRLVFVPDTPNFGQLEVASLHLNATEAAAIVDVFPGKFRVLELCWITEEVLEGPCHVLKRLFVTEFGVLVPPGSAFVLPLVPGIDKDKLVGL